MEDGTFSLGTEAKVTNEETQQKRRDGAGGAYLSE